MLFRLVICCILYFISIIQLNKINRTCIIINIEKKYQTFEVKESQFMQVIFNLFQTFKNKHISTRTQVLNVQSILCVNLLEILMKVSLPRRDE